VPFFTVIVPTHNRAVLLREALDSIFAQEFTDYELIVVDDGSTDDTRAVVSTFGERIRFYRQDNKGPGAARNLGIQHASGEYLAFLDSDDLWFPWTLSTHAQAIAEFGHPSFIAGRGVPMAQYGDADRLRLPLRCEGHADMNSACDGAMPPVGGTPSVVLQTQCVRQIGGFCNEFINGEDVDLWLRLGDARNFVRISQPVLFAQRYHAGTTTDNLDHSVRGSLFQIQRELDGGYPGGKRYMRQRRRIIAATARNVSINAAASGRIRDSARLYLKTFSWQVQLGRLKYVFGFPFFVLKKRIKEGRV
jgi:glycosyltransferase involved in cell wall biosynthesis